MKNIQVIDGALNSTFEVYKVADDLFDLMFPNGRDIAFVDEVNDVLTARGQRDFWDRVYQHPIDKKRAGGIHGTLHLTGSPVAKEYFPTRKEAEATTGEIIQSEGRSTRKAQRRKSIGGNSTMRRRKC